MSSSINQLSIVDEVTASTFFAVDVQGQDMRVAPAALSTYLDTLSTAATGDFIQYWAPASNGLSVQVNDDSQDVWLVITPSGTRSGLTINLPTLSKCIAGQEFFVSTTANLTTLEVLSAGASVVGHPTTLNASESFRLKFEPVLKTWYRIE